MSNDEVLDSLLELGKKSKKLTGESFSRKTLLNAGREALFLDQLAEKIGHIVKSSHKPTYKTYVGKKSKKIERIVNAVISDTHFGSLLNDEEHVMAFGPKEESRRFGKFIEQVGDYKREHRSESCLNIHLIGDLFEGKLHDPTEGDEQSRQVAATIQYLKQGVLYLASEYRSVNVHFTPGNHGRDKHRHHDKAINQKWDALETIVFVALKQIVQASNVKNVKFHMSLKPYYTVDLFDKKAFFTHGDTVLRPGYPGKTISMGHLYHQICKTNAARKINGPFQLFVVGHVHIGSATELPGGLTMITNPCLVPPNNFAVSIGHMDVTCGQYIFESVPGYACGDRRFVSVDDADDKPEYNQIITPFEGF